MTQRVKNIAKKNHSNKSLLSTIFYTCPKKNQNQIKNFIIKNVFSIKNKK